MEVEIRDEWTGNWTRMSAAGVERGPVWLPGLTVTQAGKGAREIKLSGRGRKCTGVVVGGGCFAEGGEGGG